MRVTVSSEDEFNDWWDACYVAGYDDAFAGRPPVEDLGDMGEPYLEGYNDGAADKNPVKFLYIP